MSQNELYDRIAKLTVFNTQTNEISLANGSKAEQLDNISSSGRSFSSKAPDGGTGFRIKFRVDKVIEVTPNPTSIWIYNLGPESRALFEKINNVIILEAGYTNKSKVIFKGNVSRTRHTKEGPDYVTHIEAADGLFAIQNSRIDQSFNSALTRNAAITTLAGAILDTGQIGIGHIANVPNDGYNNGVVLSGNAIDHMRAVCDGANLNFFIEDQLIYVLKIGDAKPVPPFIVSPDSGLVGIPERRDVGISFKTLLNPDLGIFNPVVLKSKFISGLFNTVKIVHSGDTFGTEWYTEAEATYPANPVAAS